MNMKKKCVYIIIGLIILISIFTIYATVNKDKAWHSPNEILVTVDGCDMTLDNAISTNALIDGATCTDDLEISNPGHSADEIWVSVDGNEMTLQDAILITEGLCGISSPSSSYNNSLNIGQFANEIEISSGTSLQDAINSGELVSKDGGWTVWSGWSICSVSCGGGTQIRTRTCTNPEPYCGGTSCTGSSSESQACNTQECCTPVNGGWTTWSTWSVCSGCTQIRTRTCTNPEPYCGGTSCTGSSSESQACGLVDGYWGSWSCNTCYYGTKFCTRYCYGYACGGSCGGYLVDYGFQSCPWS